MRPSALKSHWLITALLAAGLALRVLATIAYRPILFYNDSARYLLHADGNDPVGYRLPLRLILLPGNLLTVAAVQHLLGLGMAVALYLLLLRRGCPRWLAALACAPVLLDAYEVQAEQTILPEAWFEALIVAGLLLLLWRLPPPPWAVALGALAFGVSATFRQPGEILVLPAVLYLLAAARGLRRKLASAALACAAFALPALAYMTASYEVTGHFWLSRYGTAALYGRVASAADCAALRVPAAQRPMCPTEAQEAALGRDGLEHSLYSPIRRYYARLPPALAAHEVSAFTRAVLAQQPLRVAAAIGADALKLFALTRDGSPGDPPVSRWQFQLRYPSYAPHATRAQEAAAIAEFGGGGPAVAGPPASFLRTYQLHGGYTPGPLYAVAALAALTGSLSLASRRRGTAREPAESAGGPAGEPSLGPVPGRDVALAALLFLLTAAAILLVGDVFEFSWRYQLPALVTLPPAGALGLSTRLLSPPGHRLGRSPRSVPERHNLLAHLEGTADRTSQDCHSLNGQAPGPGRQGQDRPYPSGHHPLARWSSQSRVCGGAQPRGPARIRLRS